MPDPRRRHPGPPRRGPNRALTPDRNGRPGRRGRVADAPQADTMDGMTGRVDPSRETLGGVLAARRRMHFVGRAAELDLFAAALEAKDPDFRVLFVHGPGGVGKSALLDEYASLGRRRRRAGRASRRPRRWQAPTACWRPSGRRCTCPTVMAAVTMPVGHSGWSSSSTRTSSSPISTSGCATGSCRACPPRRSPWSRAAASPRPEWRADAAWSGLLRVVSLRNLNPDDARVYLDRRGVAEHRQGGGARAVARAPPDPVARRRRPGARSRRRARRATGRPRGAACSGGS